MQDENRRVSEYGQVSSENDSVNETNRTQEMMMFQEMSSVAEYPSPPETGKRKRASGNMAALLTALVAATAVTTTVVPAVTEAYYASAPVQMELLEFGIDNERAFYFFRAKGAAETPLYVTLENEFTNRRVAAECHEDGDELYIDGEFENLKIGMQYTLSVVSEGALGDRVHFKRQFTVPHPIEQSDVTLVECSADGPAIFYTINAYSYVPLQVVLKDGDKTIRESELEEGENFGSFESLTEGRTYTIQVVGEGLWGKEFVVLEESIELPLPFEE